MLPDKGAYLVKTSPFYPNPDLGVSRLRRTSHIWPLCGPRDRFSPKFQLTHTDMQRNLRQATFSYQCVQSCLNGNDGKCFFHVTNGYSTLAVDRILALLPKNCRRSVFLAFRTRAVLQITQLVNCIRDKQWWTGLGGGRGKAENGPT